MAGQGVKGVGADCIGFLCGALNELYGKELLPPQHMPDDACMHSKTGTIEIVRRFRRAYPSTVVTDDCVQPADVIVVGPAGGSPGHGMIVGGRPNVLWHATNDRVQSTGIGILSVWDWELFRVYRPRGKERW